MWFTYTLTFSSTTEDHRVRDTNAALGRRRPWFQVLCAYCPSHSGGRLGIVCAFSVAALRSSLETLAPTRLRHSEALGSSFSVAASRYVYESAGFFVVPFPSQ